ncbi:hypothetical protein EVG20_g4477 [Dentipellis fragilis]|uniref:C2H2-type domain-containing protein n=1 Tax=Dentipellis fragilis TaxID=205917 RepID=A0A4Y9YWD7_9AGAM|nr:hypothetical protein EVG20_g4477 [Dentipellis fragilis]
MASTSSSPTSERSHRTSPPARSSSSKKCHAASSTPYSRKKYRAKSSPKTSRRSDEAEERWPCHLCNKDFNRKADVNRHVMTVHKDHSSIGNLEVECEICENRFSRLDSLRRHWKSEHGGRTTAYEEA